MATEPEATLRDVKPPLEVPIDWITVAWWAAGIIVLLVLLAALIRYWIRKRRRSPVEPVKPSVPPLHEARRRLEAALRLISEPKPFCIAVSDVVRWYLERRFALHAPDRTTEEFLEELQLSDLLNADQKQVLAEFLQRCDLVKFARLEPNESELRQLHSTASRLVEDTDERTMGIGSDAQPLATSINPVPANDSQAA